MEQRGRSHSTKKAAAPAVAAAPPTALLAKPPCASSAPPGAPPPASLKRPFGSVSAATSTSGSSSTAASSHRQRPSTAAAGAVASSSSSPGGKRPYIRTRRPKDYDDRSTVTTVTAAAAAGAVADQSSSSSSAALGLGAVDAVLGESSDLLAAAHEAQQLGRYKMASAYLLLLHARLVGLGRRFDKAAALRPGGGGAASGGPKTGGIPNDNGTPRRAEGPVHDEPDGNGGGSAVAAASSAVAPTEASPKGVPDVGKGPVPAPPAVAAPPTAAASNTPADDRDPLTPQTRAAKTFARLLPRDIELDQAMMEHLARAAVELHAARSGKRKAAGQPHIFRSPDPQSFWATTANQRGVTTAATRHQLSAGVAEAAGPPATTAQRPSAAETATTSDTVVPTAMVAASADPASATKATGGCGIAWTDQEIATLNRAVARGTREPHDLAALLPGRTDRQIKLYLKNQTQRLRVHQEALETLAEDHHHPVANPQQAQPHHPNHSNKSGGTGRKPATAAMNTVPNAVCDVRALLAKAGAPPIPPGTVPPGT